MAEEFTSPLYNNTQRTLCSTLRFITRFEISLCQFFSMVSTLDAVRGAGWEDAGHVCVRL